MTKERFIELQTEIAKLKEMDRKTTDRVRTTYSIEDKVINRMNVDEFEDNAPEPEPDYIDFLNKEGKYTKVHCSKELDMEWANELDNVQ